MDESCVCMLWVNKCVCRVFCCLYLRNTRTPEESESLFFMFMIRLPDSRDNGEVVTGRRYRTVSYYPYHREKGECFALIKPRIYYLSLDRIMESSIFMQLIFRRRSVAI